MNVHEIGVKPPFPYDKSLIEKKWSNRKQIALLKRGVWCIRI